MIKNYITKEYYVDTYKGNWEQDDETTLYKDFSYYSQLASEKLYSIINTVIFGVIEDLPILIGEGLKYATAQLVNHYLDNGTNFSNIQQSAKLGGFDSSVSSNNDINFIPQGILDTLSTYGLYKQFLLPDEEVIVLAQLPEEKYALKKTYNDNDTTEIPNGKITWSNNSLGQSFWTMDGSSLTNNFKGIVLDMETAQTTYSVLLDENNYNSSFSNSIMRRKDVDEITILKANQVDLEIVEDEVEELQAIIGSSIDETYETSSTGTFPITPTQGVDLPAMLPDYTIGENFTITNGNRITFLKQAKIFNIQVISNITNSQARNITFKYVLNGITYETLLDVPSGTNINHTFQLPIQFDVAQGEFVDMFFNVDSSGGGTFILNTPIDWKFYISTIEAPDLSNYYTKTESDVLLDEKLDSVNPNDIDDNLEWFSSGLNINMDNDIKITITNDGTTFGDVLNMNNVNRIINVAPATLSGDAVNKSQLDLKADQTTTYTKTESDGLLSDKVDKVESGSTFITEIGYTGDGSFEISSGLETPLTQITKINSTEIGFKKTINMWNQKIYSLADGTDPEDAVNKQQLDLKAERNLINNDLIALGTSIYTPNGNEIFRLDNNGEMSWSDGLGNPILFYFVGGDLSINNLKLVDLATPTNINDGATKGYVDDTFADLTPLFGIVS